MGPSAMSRRSFMAASAGTSAAVLALSHLSAAKSNASHSDYRPNIVHFMTDDQGWVHAGYMDIKPVKTPNMDAMAENGLVFTNYHSPSAVCTPSRLSITDGRSSTRTCWIGVGGQPNEPFKSKDACENVTQAVTTADGLKTVGYTTGHFIKSHGASQEGMDVVEYAELENPDGGNNECEEDDHGVTKAIEFMTKVVSEGTPVYARIWVHSPHKKFTAPQEFVNL